tara:strand:+ start:6543 stop:6998 length:456 start_codon:yes stop_codon:yes gene_type:complete
MEQPEVETTIPDNAPKTCITDATSLHEVGYRKEASLLKKENRSLRERIEYLEAENQDIRDSLVARFNRVHFDRENPLRRELLITLHNCLEHCRAFGEVVPHYDFVNLGFKDHRTLQRSCNKFAEIGFLIKIRSNPTSFKLNPEQITKVGKR